MKTSSEYIIFFDFETGGLPNKNARAFYEVPLVETAMVVVDMEKLEICEECSMIFESDYKEDLLPVSAEALAVHGITKEIQESKGVPLKEIYKKWLDLFKKYKNPRQMCTIAGHNAVGFDTPFLKNFFEYMGDSIDNYVKYYLDTMQIAHMAALEQQDYKLHTCCELFNIDIVNAHRALDDTKANALLGIEYIKLLRGINVSSSITNSTSQETGFTRFREKFQL